VNIFVSKISNFFFAQKNVSPTTSGWIGGPTETDQELLGFELGLIFM
jgi:hypothetical protein